MAKPAITPTWECTNPGAEVTDPLTKTLEGWHTGEAVTAGHINYLFKQITNYLAWVNTYAAGLELNNSFIGNNYFDGDNIFVGDQQLQGSLIVIPTGAEDEPAITIDTNTAVSTYRALSEINPNSTDTDKTFLYVSADGDLVITRNCYWDTDTSTWIPTTTDIDDAFSKCTLTKNNLVFQVFNRLGVGDTSWVESEWFDILDLRNGVIHAVFAEKDDPGVPLSGVAQNNKITPTNVAKMWITAHATYNVSPYIAVTDGFNVGSIALESATSIRITFASYMGASTYYAVFGHYSSSDASKQCIVRCLDKTEEYCIVAVYVIGGTYMNFETDNDGGFLDVMVMGKQYA